MSPVDTIVTLARRSPTATLLRAVQTASFSAGLDLVELTARTGRGITGSRRLNTAIDTYLRGHDSAPELVTYRCLAAAALPPDHTNVWLVTQDGVRVGPVDGYYELGVAYEYDGLAAHASREAHVRDSAKADRLSGARVALARLGAAHLADRRRLVADVRRVVDRRRLEPPPAARVEHSAVRSCVCGWVPHRP